ncbi:multidrug and toxin extrusion protein 1-like [Thalassophryne amazonica]|uniref:multidrug and toxin extrusion protein 1-like n=1 Tax=Thalassophryne amazonica TaxID=390379 RepID=UPI00147228A8|nr:multidrug and toxin extrusion protein 1-like [Thalassophryne amazonica]
MDGCKTATAKSTPEVKSDPGADQAAPGAQGSVVGCVYLKRMRDIIPAEYRNELVEVVKLAGPVVLSEMMAFMISVVSTIFCGHLGKMELAAVSLATAVINVTGISIGTGLAQACDTLITQTYGSGNLKRVGVILQRGILILLLACFPCWALLINTEPILLAVRQNPEVARLSQLYVNVTMPALPAAFLFHLHARYLQSQGIIWPQVVTGAAANLINVVINYILLYYMDFGIVGSAAANMISQVSLLVLLYMYTRWRGLHKATWEGWSLDCLQEWGLFMKVAVPSMLTLCLEWWMFEIGGFLAGLISEGDLGAQYISYELSVIIYMSPVGFSAAASIRVGNALGAGNIEQAKLSCKVPIICASVITCVLGATLIITRNVIGYIFTSEEDIVQKVAEVMFIFGFIQAADGAAGVIAGVLRGAGKQLIGAACNLVGYYIIGLPIGVPLMFATQMGISGLWTGFAICVILQSVFLVIYLYNFNWQKAAEEALVRAGIQTTEQKQTDQTEKSDSNQGEVLFLMSPSTCVSVEEGDTRRETRGPVQIKSTTTTVGEVLSGRQLLIRRSLTVLLMVLIPVAGILAKHFLLKQFK